MKLLILAEKASAMNNFKDDLGGLSGEFNGNHYQLVRSQGHIMQLKSPDKQVTSDKLVEKYADWHSLANFPWNPQDFKWEKEVVSKYRKVFNNIKAKSKNADAIVIATDNDSTGEGDLLAWEIINALGWHKKVFREYHSDETKAGFTKALRNMEDVSDQMKQGVYLKARGRQRFDFMSMQLVRIATILAREAGYNVKVMNGGRLKSVIMDTTYNQWIARKNYVKKPYFEVRYKDDHGNVLKRTFKDGDKWRWPSEMLANNDLRQNYGPDTVTVDSKKLMRQAPPALLTLTQLAILLSKKGYKNGAIMNTYQTMYQDHYLSYPRTDDTKITMDQYNELLPLKDKIANVVGVDTKLLTHLKPRAKHIVKAAPHGANRPGLKVPSSLDMLEKKYGKLGALIYEAVAKSYLAMLCEDYVYEHQKAYVTNHKDFTGTVNIPKQLNYKAVFDENALRTKKKDEEENSKSFGTKASGFIYQGVNPKPQKPTPAFILGFLKRHNIGTPATQVTTLAAVAEGQHSLLKEKRGAYELTNAGWIDAYIYHGTMIASPNTTKQVFDLMDKVATFELNTNQIPLLMNQIVNHDLPIMKANAKKLKDGQAPIMEDVEDLKAKAFKKKPQASFEKEGREIKFNKEWGGHTFTPAEIADLAAGAMITFEFKKKNGEKAKVQGALAKQTYKKHSFWGFKPMKWL